MSILPVPSSPRDISLSYTYSWGETCAEPEPQPGETPRVALPSIRQVIPELQLKIRKDVPTKPSSSVSTPPCDSFNSAVMGTPEYIHSPNRTRQGASSESEEDLEDNYRMPRRYASTRGEVSQQPSPPLGLGAAPEPWANSHQGSPHGRNGTLPQIQSPVRLETRERAEPRPTLPSLPLLNLERERTEPTWIPVRSGDEHVQDVRRPSLPGDRYRALEPGLSASNPFHMSELGPSPARYHHVPQPGPTTYLPANTGYGYQHPSRIQAPPVGTPHPYDRPALPSRPYAQDQFQDDFFRLGEYGIGLQRSDARQRRRRGNLPKETTDRLRTWFFSHLHHPYPTEDEKQEMMRQTGLQMNQISNWFINARRRQLPALINNARAESDAMTGRSSDGNLLPSTERLDYDADAKPLSEGEGASPHDFGIEAMKRRRVAKISRGSI
ncbi:hypothetical protein GGS23DRAFT_602014 [Durotheca rogersii]|uniref:uncharacterized protein n=1 Tax=Durotheca rogersii TaxID=419775 RepID=UPI002220F72F|nr:uncharacterized protein GGS23DRAFT_602014 [Durotheca rogersii]KAI5868089.1 hypothetical protein GGS23DRAFT_602014 [Durotheca rogersii]